jgi:hypothetical protein
MREMHVLKNIKHPNIIQLHEVSPFFSQGAVAKRPKDAFGKW